MKIIIAGSRWINLSPERIEKYVKRAEEAFGQEMTELVSGMARGIDTSGLEWREKYRPHISLKEFPYGDYIQEAIEKHGTRKMGGHVRNKAMADYAQGLILIWDGVSGGSSRMYREAYERGIPIFEVILKKKS